MANEISISVSASLTLGGSTIATAKQKVADIAGNEGLQQIDTATTTDAQLALSALNTLGYLVIENLDATNFIQISTGTGGSFAAGIIGKCRAGFPWAGEPPSQTLYIKSDTANCIYKMTAFEV